MFALTSRTGPPPSPPRSPAPLPTRRIRAVADGLERGLDAADQAALDAVGVLAEEREAEHAKRHGERHPITDAEVGKKHNEFIPDLKTKRPMKPWGDCSRPKRYLLSDLATCRTAFLKKMNIPDYEWPQEDHT